MIEFLEIEIIEEMEVCKSQNLLCKKCNYGRKRKGHPLMEWAKIYNV